MSIKNIIFDLGNVLLRLDQSASAEAFKALGATNFPTLSQHASSVTIVAYETGKISAEEFRATVRSSIGLPETVTDEQFDQAWNAMLLDFPKDRLELMRTLQKDFGYKVFLLSNTNAIHIEHVDKVCLKDYEEKSLHPFFHKVFYSHEIGHRKPSQEAFAHILQEQSLTAGETLFLDDMLENVEAAKACGLQAAQVDAETDLGFLQLRF
ncbi:hypothetical protein BGZ70_008157 [Mortierella alpina]|uniref:HAD family phosphatase n=1 Tax=Mortierella alpina TaxID=64518 RepID=A0A9P6J479_MORAP|nr:hypothetical protein BGZ70_008157 [Mortierella alpina]